MAIHLSLPPLNAAATAAEPFSAEQTVLWLDSLGTDGSIHAAAQLVQRLGTLNAHRVRVSVRHDLSERFFRAVMRCLPPIETSLAGASVPLANDFRAAAQVADDLLAGMAVSYKILLIELSRRLFGLASSGRALLPVHRTMALHARRMMIGYRVYSSPPKGVWLEMHELFQFATRRGLAQRRLDQEIETPTSIYKKALLTAFADPQRLMAGELEELATLVGAHVDHAVLGPWRAQELGGGTFIVRPHRDSPGSPVTRHRHASLHKDDWVFAAGPVARKLESSREFAANTPLDRPSQPGPEQREQALVAQLVKQWGSTPMRRLNRLRTHARVEILVGISAIWSFLSDAGGESSASEGWIVTNESPSGFALMHAGGAVPPIAVGEVVGLRSANMRGCHVCVVRWVLSDNPEHVELGLEEIAPSARPAMMRTFGGEIQPLQVLLLPDAPSEVSGPTLVTPVLALDSDCELSVGEFEAKLQIQPRRLAERTNNVQIVSFGSMS